MKEPTKSEIGSAVIALLNLQEAIYKGWYVTPQLGKAINDLINDLKFYYQFAPNTQKGGTHSLLSSSLPTSK